MLKRLKANRKQQREQQQQCERISQFLEAARLGDLEKLLGLVRSNVDVNTKNENDLYALHLAAKEGHVEVIKELLKRGAVVDAVTKKGNAALHLACLAGQLEAVKVLVENGANVNLQSQNGFTTLYMAAQENHESVVKLLLERGADAAIRNNDGYLPLDVAMQQGHGKLVASLLENDPSNTVALPALHVAAKRNDTKTASFLVENGFAVNTPSKSGFSALHIAARYGNYDVCKALIDKGADVNWKAKNDITPLHVSSREGHSSVVELLLNSGAQSDSQTAEGLTALHCAAVNGHDQVLDSLVRSGASLSSKTKNGLTPLHMALQGNQASCTRQLLQYNAPIDDTTEDNLTPLHVAAHCGNLRSAQILLDSGCDVNTEARNGFTPLHIACMKNHVEMAGLLLQHDSNIKAATDSGLCPLHVAAFLGHLEVAACLIQHGANVDAATEKRMTGLYLATLSNKTEMVKFLLQSGAAVDAATVDGRTALHTGSELGNSEDVRLLLEHGALPGIKTTDGFSPLDIATRTGNREIVQLLMEHGAIQGEESFQKHPSSSSSSLAEFSMIRDELKYVKGVEIGIKTPKLKRKSLEESGHTPVPRSKPCGRDSRLSHVVSSLSLSESPSLSFWASFLTDARGGEMVGCRHSGVRIILPPSKVPRPMGITCKLIRKEKLPFLPTVKEGEALACRALETSPAGSKFLGPVIFEVPHFASLRGQEREIIILRSDNGRSWSEHTAPPFDDIEPTLQNALLTEMLRQNSSLVHIITVDLPRFFALISRIRMEQKEISVDGGCIVSTLFPKVKISFPEDSCLRETKLGLQAQPIQRELVSKFLGDQTIVSPIVTIEPRRRKFHHPISMTIPVSDDNSQVSRRNLKLLCSISKGNNPALWEDITDLAPLASAKELVSFTTAVSGKYWFLDYPDLDAKMLANVQKLYSVAIAVPFFSKFVVFAKRLSRDEGRLRIFCMTDDKVDKTLERQEQFVEVARSDDVEVLEGTAQYINMQGNLHPIGDFKDDWLHLNFHAFRENRLPVAVRVVDPSQEAKSIVTFLRDPGVHNSWSEICTLEVILPKFGDETLAAKWKTPSVVIKDSKQKQPPEEPPIQKAELRLKDIAELLGEEWKPVAGRLGIIPEEVEEIVGSDNATPNAEALAMLQQWVQKNGSNANGNTLERALRDLGRDDIIASCMCNIADVTDSKEKAAAKNYLDSGVDPLKTEIGSVQDLGSSRPLSVWHSLSPDVAYDEENLSKMAFILPDDQGIYDQENKYVEDMFRESRVGERFPFIDRSISTVSTNTLTTLPSDGETRSRYQSVDEISSEDQGVLKAQMEEEEEEQMLEDGTCIRRKIVTVRHLKRQLGSEDTLIGVEVEEDVLELAPGVELPLGEDVDVERHMEEFVENLSSGVWTTRKVTTTKARKLFSEEEASGVPEEESEDLVPHDFSESKAEPTSHLDFVSGGDILPKKCDENLPVEVEEELFEAQTRPVFCSRPRPASGWKPEVSSEDQINKETIIEGREGESEDKRDGGLSSRYSNIYEVPEIEPNICRVILENGERIQKKLALKNKEAGTHLIESNVEQNQDRQGCYLTSECMDVNEPTDDGVSASGKELQELGMKDAFDISLRQFTEEKRDADLIRPFCNTDDEKNVGKLKMLKLPESTSRNQPEYETQLAEIKNKTSDKSATMHIASINLESGHRHEHEMLNQQKEIDVSLLSAPNLPKTGPVAVVSLDMPLSSRNAQGTKPDKVEYEESVSSTKGTLPLRMPTEFTETLSSAEQRLADETLPLRMPTEFTETLSSAEQRLADEASSDLAKNALLAECRLTGEISSRSAETVFLTEQILAGEQSESAETDSNTKKTVAGRMPYESADAVLSAEPTVACDTESESAETLSNTDQRVTAAEAELTYVKAFPPSKQSKAADATTIGAEAASYHEQRAPRDTFVKCPDMNLFETSPEIETEIDAQSKSVEYRSETFDAAHPEKRTTNCSAAERSFSTLPLTETTMSGADPVDATFAIDLSGNQEEGPCVQDAGTGYLWTEAIRAESSKEGLSGHLGEQRPSLSDVSTGYLGAGMTKTEPSQEVLSRQLNEQRPFVPEAGTPCLGAEVIRAGTSREVFSRSPDYTLCVTEAGTGHLGADVIGTDASKEVLSGYLEEYRPYISEAGTGCLEAEMAIADESKQVFSRYPDEYRVYIPEAGSGYMGAEVTKTVPSKEVSSGDEEYRPHILEVSSEYIEADMTKAGVSKEVLIGYPTEYRPDVSKGGSGYLVTQATGTESSKDVFHKHLDENRPYISEACTEYLGAEETRLEPSQDVFSGYPEDNKPCIAEAGTGHLAAEVIRAETSQEVYIGYPGQYRSCVSDDGSGYLGVKVVRAEPAQDAFRGYKEQGRPCITEADTGYAGAEATSAEPSQVAFSGHPEEYFEYTTEDGSKLLRAEATGTGPSSGYPEEGRPCVVGAGTEYLGTEVTRARTSEQYRPSVSEDGSGYLAAVMRTEPSKEVYTGYPEQYRLCATEDGSGYLGAEVMGTEPSKDVFIGYPEEYRPCLSKAGTGYLEAEMIRAETSREVFSISQDYTLRVTEAGTRCLGADITGRDAPKEVLSGYLEEYRPFISAGTESLEAEMERVDESRVFSSYPNEHRVYIPEAGSGYQGVEKTLVDKSKEVFSGHPREYRQCVPEVGSEYLGPEDTKMVPSKEVSEVSCEYLEGQTTRTELSKDAFPKYLEEYRPCISETCTEYLGAEVTRAEPSEEISIGYPEGRLCVMDAGTEYLGTEVTRAEASEQYRLCVTEDGSGYLPAEVMGTEPSKYVFSGYPEEYRPCLSEAGTGYLGAEMIKAETSRGVFSRSPLRVTEAGTGHLGNDVIGTEPPKEVYAVYPEQYRPCATEDGSGYEQVGVMGTEPSKDVFSGYPEEFRPCLSEAGTGYLGAEMIRADTSRGVFSRSPLHVTEAGTGHLGAEDMGTEPSKEVYAGYPEQYRPCITEDGSGYLGVEVLRTEPSKDVFSGYPEEYRPCLSEVGSGYLGAEMRRAETSREVSNRYPDEYRPCLSEAGTGYRGTEMIRAETSRGVFSRSPLHVTDAGTGHLGADVTGTGGPKEVLSGYLEEYRPFILAAGTECLEAEMERVDESRVFSSYPNEHIVYIPEAGSGYQGVEKTMVDKSKQVFSGHPREYRQFVPEVGSEYLGPEDTKTVPSKEVSEVRSEYLEGQTTRTELLKDAFPKYLEEYGPCISETCTEYLGAEFTRAEPSEEIFSGYPGEGKPFVMDTGTEYLGTEVTRAEASEQYRPCVTEDGSGYLGDKVMRTEPSKDVFSGYPEQYRPCVTEDSSGYLGAEVMGTEPSKDVFSGYPEQYRPCVTEDGMAVDRKDVSTLTYSKSGREQVAYPMHMFTKSPETGREIESELIELPVSTGQLKDPCRVKMKAGDEEFPTGGTEIRKEVAPDTIHLPTIYPEAGQTIEIEPTELSRGYPRYPNVSDLAIGFMESSSAYPEIVTEIEPTEISRGCPESIGVLAEYPTQAYTRQPEPGRGIEIEPIELSRGYPIYPHGREMAVDLKALSTGCPRTAVSTEYAVQSSKSEMGFDHEKLSMVYSETGIGVAVEPAKVFGGCIEAGGRTALAPSQLLLVPEGDNKYLELEAAGIDLSEQSISSRRVKNETCTGEPAVGKFSNPMYPGIGKYDVVHSEWQTSGNSKSLEPNDSSLQTLTPVDSDIHPSTPNDLEAQTFKANYSEGRTFSMQYPGSRIVSAEFSPSETDISSSLDMFKTEMETRRTGETTSGIFVASAAPQIITARGQNLGKKERFIPHLLECKTFKEKEESTADGKVPYEKHARVILRRCVHKKTVITGCQEETMVTEDTHVEQDSETPRELNHAIRLIIEQFVQGESNFDTGYGAA